MRAHHEAAIVNAAIDSLSTLQTLGYLALPALAVGVKTAKAIRAAVARLKGGAL